MSGAEHWDGVAPGERETAPIALPEEGELGPEECYVPAGWCWIGRGRGGADSLPARRLWVDAFVIARFPVTNRAWLAYLDELLARRARGGCRSPRARASRSAVADGGDGLLAWGA